MKTVFITNIPAPYREKVHSLVSESGLIEYKVMYCSSTEPNREWKFKLGNYDRLFINSKPYEIFGRYFYVDFSIYGELNKFSPNVVIISGFSIPFLLAFIWAYLNHKKIIFFSDATLMSEERLSVFHKFLRKFVFKKCDAFLGASLKTKALFNYYTPSESKFYQSHLCVDNDIFSENNLCFQDRDFDILLCGQMVPRKMFDYSLDVIEEVLKIKPNLKVKILGSGILKDTILRRLDNMNVEYCYPGFVSQSELPVHYKTAKIFLFPSQCDPWGVVANESCAAGTPVISCEAVGAAHELLIHNSNSFVLDLNVSLWVDKILFLLNNQKAWEDMSCKAIEKSKEYNYKAASEGILNAIKSSLKN